jgi:hypothetical protein
MKTASAHTILAALAVQAATVRSAPRLNPRQTDSACAAVGSIVVESTQQNREMLDLSHGHYLLFQVPPT